MACCEDIPILGDIEEAVHDIGDAIGDVFEFVGDVVEDVVDGVGDVLETVGDTIGAIVEDPRKLAMVALSVLAPGAGTALGTAMGLGTTTAATVVGQVAINTALNGGDVKSAIISAAIPLVGKELAGAAAASFVDAGMDAALADSVGKVVAGAGISAAQGKDPLQALIDGGLSAGTAAVTRDIPGFADLPEAAKRSINAAVAAELTGKDPTQAAINSALSVGANALRNAVATGGVEQEPLSPDELRQLVDNRLDKMFFANNDLDAQDEEISARTQEILDELAGVNTPSDYDEFLRSIGITNQSGSGTSPSNQEILDAIFYEPGADERPNTTDLGTVEVVGDRPPADDLGEIEIIGDRPDTTDLGEIEIVGERPPTDELPPESDLGVIEVTGDRPVSTPPGTPPVATTPPSSPTPAQSPFRVPTIQVAQALDTLMSSPTPLDVTEALYGTMGHLDISEEFDPSRRKVTPAATQKQLQQTKMAQGGYLDNLLAENMSVDDLLKLLR